MAKTTQLDAPQERAYRDWLKQIGQTPGSGYNVDQNWSGTDYDYRGFFKKYGPADIKQGQHFTDEFKLPNHETFSDESIYAVGADKARAGHWNGEKFVPAVAQGKPVSVNVPGFDKPVMFPAGMTAEQIQHAIETDILPNRSPKVVSIPGQQPVESPSILARIGRGMMDVGQGAKQRMLQLGEAVGSEQRTPMIVTGFDQKTRQPIMKPQPGWKPSPTAEGYTAQVNDELAFYNKGRKAQGGGFDWGRMLGNIAGTAPLAAIAPEGATVGARIIQGALTGGEAGALNFQPSGKISDTVKSTAVGAGVGAVAAPVIGAVTDKAVSLIQKLGGYLKGARADVTPGKIVQDVPELTALDPAAQRDLITEAQAQIRKTGTLDAEAIARKANLIANDVTPTKSMVTRSPRDWTMERNLQKLSQSPDEQLAQTGEKLTGVYQANDKALANRLGSFSEGLPKGTQEAHGMAAMKSLDDLATASQKDVSNLYSAVRAAKGDQLASDARNLATTLEDLKDNTYAEKLVSSVSNKLKRFGMIDAEGKLTNNTLTVMQAEELRKFVNRLPNDFGKSDIIKSIDADVLSGMGQDAFSAARAAAKTRFASLENPATQKALNTFGELTQGKTAQNFIKSQVIDAADQDVASLVSTLQKIPPQKMPNGSTVEALDSLRAGVLQHLQDEAINVNSGKFSGAALNKAMEQVGERKLIQIFGVPKYMQLRSLARAALDATYEPPYSAVNASNTAPMLLSLMQKSRTIPGVPLLITDEAAKMAARSGYQSQLGDVLAAKATGKFPQLPATIEGIAQALRATSAPVGYAALNQFREPANKLEKKRQ